MIYTNCGRADRLDQQHGPRDGAQHLTGCDFRRYLSHPLGRSDEAPGALRLHFAAEKWGHHLPAYDRERAYRGALDALQAGSGVPRGLVEVAMAAVHTTRKGWWELALHIRGAYAEGVPELELAEGISYAMFPGSIPNFVDACGVWQGMVARGEVPASEVFRIWGADAANQSGFG